MATNAEAKIDQNGGIKVKFLPNNLVAEKLNYELTGLVTTTFIKLPEPVSIDTTVKSFKFKSRTTYNPTAAGSANNSEYLTIEFILPVAKDTSKTLAQVKYTQLVLQERNAADILQSSLSLSDIQENWHPIPISPAKRLMESRSRLAGAPAPAHIIPVVLNKAAVPATPTGQAPAPSEPLAILDDGVLTIDIDQASSLKTIILNFRD